MTLRAAALLLGLWAPAAAAAEACEERFADLRWPGGSARFEVELADTAEKRARGLMFREALAADAGMLFVYDHPQGVAFWMRNTLIALDMLFIGADGRVNRVHPMAIPGDETAIPGPPDTQMVLEIPGGRASALGIAEGAELRHPRVDSGLALWPCDQP